MHHFFFFNDTATTEIYTLSLHDALPISIGRPTARSTSLLLSQALTQGDEKLAQLIERLDHCIGCSGAGSVERLLRSIALVQDHQRLAALFLQRHRGDTPALATFLICPREARLRLHFDTR